MREIKIVYGKTGTGKSFYVKSIIDKLERVIIIDPKSEYEGTIFFTLSDLIDYFENIRPKNFKISCRFESDIEIELLFKFCNIIENVTLVVEEAEIYISPYSKSSNFLDLCRYGRHHNISIIGVARRTAELSINFRSLVTEIISFKQTEPLDLKNMEKLGLYNLDTLADFKFSSIRP